MSFGFGVGDIITVTNLARQLYKDVYQVARKAPEQIRSLSLELGALSTSLDLLGDELRSPDSILVKAGSDRVKTIKSILQETEKMLTEMSKTMEKYEAVNSEATTSKWKRRLAMSKYPMETSTIDNFRARMAQQYGYIQLLLTSAGNSSLERIEAEHRAVAARIEEQKGLLETLIQQGGRQEAVMDKLIKQGGNQTIMIEVPTISAVEAHDQQSSLSRRFMECAEFKGSWLSIGLDAWIRAGKWWLMKGQVELRRTAAPAGGSIPTQAYVNLLKASWIMLDVINLHPQRTYTHSGSQQMIVQTLASSINAELRSLKDGNRSLPPWREVLLADHSIWVDVTVAVRLELTRRATSNLTPFVWGIEGQKVVYQVFAEYMPLTGKPVECVVIACYHEHNKTLHLYGQTFSGSDMFYVSAEELWFARLQHDKVTVRKFEPRNDADTDTDVQSDSDSDSDSDSGSDNEDKGKSDKKDDEEAAKSKEPPSESTHAEGASNKDSDSEWTSGSDTSSNSSSGLKRNGSVESSADSASDETDERGLTLNFNDREDAMVLFTFLRGFDTWQALFQPSSGELPDYLAGALLCDLVESLLYKAKGEAKKTSNGVELARQVRELDDRQPPADQESNEHNAFVHLSRVTYDRITEDMADSKALTTAITATFKRLVKDLDEFDDIEFHHIFCAIFVFLSALDAPHYRSVLKAKGFVLYKGGTNPVDYDNFFPLSFKLAWRIRHAELLRDIVETTGWSKAWAAPSSFAKKENPLNSEVGRLFLKVVLQEPEKGGRLEYLMGVVPEFRERPRLGATKLTAREQLALGKRVVAVGGFTGAGAEVEG